MAQPCLHCGQVHDAYVTACPLTGKRIAPHVSSIGEDDVLVGSVVSERYLVREILGQGTTGTVFRVENVHLGRPAAMKVLRPRYASLDTLQRIVHGEARSAWSVTHACLCEVFDVGTLPDGMPYFVMERLEGETLATRIARDRLSLAAAVDVMMQLLAAIDTIHTRGLLLRDLRPQNVFLANRRGCRPLVKITDFGLSRLVPIDRLKEQWDSQGSVEVSDPPGSMAIPYYFSPESARGDQGVEPASDIFVAAVLFYEALTGEKPFVSMSWEGLLLQISQGTPRPLAELRPDIPAEVGAVVERALSSDPRARHSSAGELQDALRFALDGTTARRPSTQMRAVASPPSSGATSIDAAAYMPRDPAPSRPAPEAQAPSAAVLVAAMRGGGETTSRPLGQTGLTSVVNMDVAARALDDLYSEETQTNRKYFAEVAAAQAAMSRPVSTAPRFDEASADNPQKTVRPPSLASSSREEIDVPIDFDPVSEANHEDKTTPGESIEHATQVVQAQAAARPRAIREDEETETMQLTPELRRRIEQMSRPQTTPIDAPPETRRISKPPR